jgi:sulfate adenylyltransferase subunit 2
MHVDTGQNFEEVIEFRDQVVDRHDLRLLVLSVQDDIDAGRAVEEGGPDGPRNRLQTVTLLRGMREHAFGAAFGGARRDEDRARAKERIFSFRDGLGQWDPRNQRPELWSLYNGRHRPGEHIRVFPLSNWTELDIWRYIAKDGIAVPSLYFTHQRTVLARDGMLLPVGRFIRPGPGEEPFEASVRFRTVGDATTTGCVESLADTAEAIVAEISAARLTERGATRADDRVSEAGMEDRKKEGYF